MICDRCGRLLNRATGRCVCDDYGGNAPPPVALTHPPTEEDESSFDLAELLDGPDPLSALSQSPLPPSPSRPDPFAPPPEFGGPAGPSPAPARPSPFGPGAPGVPHGNPFGPGAPGVPHDLGPGGPARPAAPAGPGAGPAAPPRPAAPATPAARPATPPPPGPYAPAVRSAAPAAPPPAPAPTPAVPEAPRPVSAAAAFAVLDVSDKPARPAPPKPAPSPEPAEPAAPAAPERHPGVALGTVVGVRSGRRRFDAIIYEGCIVLARRPRSKPARAARAAMTAPQLANVHPDNRLMADNAVEDVSVREDPVGGKARIKLRSGETVSLSWWGPRNRGVDVEHLLHDAFPGRVDQASPEIPARVARGVGTVAAGVAVVMALITFVPRLLESEPPPPPPPPPATTLPPAEQALRGEVATACGPWNEQIVTLPLGTRPAPEALRGPTGALRGALDNAAAASPEWTTARDELAFLQDYAGRPADVALRESVSRINYAIRTVSTACAKAGSSQ